MKKMVFLLFLFPVSAFIAFAAPPTKEAPPKQTPGFLWIEKTTCTEEKIQQGIEAWVIERSKRIPARSIRPNAKLYAERVMLEAKRHNLDPIVMTVMTWIETDYRTNLLKGMTGGQGRRAGEIGIWQLIPWDSAVLGAARASLGCKPGKASPRYLKWWKKWHSHKPCLAPDIIQLRDRVGKWTHKELRDLRIGTYVAGYEMRAHINASLKRREWGLKKIPWLLKHRVMRHLPKANWTYLERYCHYNWGTRYLPPGKVAPAYRWKLFTRYRIVRKRICPPIAATASK